MVHEIAFNMKRTKDIADIETPRSAAHLVSPDERAAAGKVLRDRIPRKQHGEWNTVQGRPNPIDLLHKSDAGRLKRLVPIRYGRMLQSPFAFYRGSCRGHGLGPSPNANHGANSASVWGGLP